MRPTGWGHREQVKEQVVELVGSAIYPGAILSVPNETVFGYLDKDLNRFSIHGPATLMYVSEPSMADVRASIGPAYSSYDRIDGTPMLIEWASGHCWVPCMVLTSHGDLGLGYLTIGIELDPMRFKGVKPYTKVR